MLYPVDRHVPQAISLLQQGIGRLTAFVEASMKKIPLTRGKFALVDDENYGFLMQWKWRLDKIYAARTITISRINGKRKRATIYMHREIIKAKEGQITDHVDGDGLNNQRKNLRFCSHRQNMQNRKINKKIGFKGTKRASKNRWQARICGKYIGIFKTQKEAALSYNSAAIKKFGKFARLNEVKNV